MPPQPHSDIVTSWASPLKVPCFHEYIWRLMSDAEPRTTCLTGRRVVVESKARSGRVVR